MQKRTLVTIGVFSALFGVLIGAGMIFVITRNYAPTRAVQPPPLVPAEVSEASQDAIVAAVERVGAAVVNINTLRVRPARTPIDQLMRQFGMPTQPFPEAGRGSGFIIDGERGYILTNTHVVRDAQRVMVVLQDGRQLEASVVGVDPLTEVAVVEVSDRNLPEAPLGSVEDVSIGSWVIAIGNPFGFENSVTVGVLSAKDRQINSPTGVVLQELLQTDASINPGNSGGALVDLSGRVIGIPTAIIPYAQGMGFAVSIDVAREVAERLIETGAMPWLGIQFRTLMPDEARELNLPNNEGAMVIAVMPDGPAARAGLSSGDFIIALEAQPITKARDLSRAIRAHNAGDRVELTIIREGREEKLQVTLGRTPQSP